MMMGKEKIESQIHRILQLARFGEKGATLSFNRRIARRLSCKNSGIFLYTLNRESCIYLSNAVLIRNFGGIPLAFSERFPGISS
jgi:hypothetical protein